MSFADDEDVDSNSGDGGDAANGFVDPVVPFRLTNNDSRFAQLCHGCR